MDEGAETDSSLVVETSRDEVQPKESAIGDDEMADSSISFLSDGQSASEVSLDKDISDIPFVAALSNSGTTNGDLDAQDQTLTDLSLLSSDQQSEREVARSASNEEGNAESDELSGISDPIQDLNLGNDEMRKVDSFTEPVGPDFDGPQNDAVDKDGDAPSAVINDQLSTSAAPGDEDVATRGECQTPHGADWSHPQIPSEGGGESDIFARLLNNEVDLSIRQGADNIVLAEDTDLKLCAPEPELDGEPMLHYGPTDDESKKHESLHETQQGRVAQNKSGTSSAEKSGDPLLVRDQSTSPNRPPRVPKNETSPGEQGFSRDAQMVSPLFSDLPTDASPLPDAAPVLASGLILTRSSTKTLLMKKWSPAVWVRYGPAVIYTFRSGEDFADWLTNPYHSQKQRDYLVKARIDFSSELKKPGVRGFRTLDIKQKQYQGRQLLFNFKVERWTDLGVSLVAAFASSSVGEINAAHDAIRSCLDMCPHKGLRPIGDLIVKPESDA